MSNRRISELNQLFPGDIERSDYLLILDTGTPETKKISVGDITDYIVGEAGGVTSGSVQELSSSVVILSASVSSINGETGSFATVSQLNDKLDNALTSSFFPLQAFGIPTLSSSGMIYPQFLPNSLNSFNERYGDIIPTYGDYSASIIPFDSSSNVPQTNVQSAIEYLGTNKFNITGGTLTGPLILSEDPVSGSQATTKNYADLSVKKSGDTMTGPLVAPGITISTDLLYISSGTSSVGIGTTDPTESAKLHVVGRIRVDELQFSADESIQTIAGGVYSFNGRSGYVSSDVNDYLGKYVDTFNGRSGSVSSEGSDYEGFYIKTTGDSSVINANINVLDSFLSFENTLNTQSNDTSSILFKRTNSDTRILNTSIYENATSSLNGLIQDGDFAIILGTTLSGSEQIQYDTGTEGIVIGCYSSGSNGLRVTKDGVFTENLTVSNILNVNVLNTTTTTNLLIEDKTITLNFSGSDATSTGSGILVSGSSGIVSQILFDPSASSKWTIDGNGIVTENELSSLSSSLSLTDSLKLNIIDPISTGSFIHSGSLKIYDDVEISRHIISSGSSPSITASAGAGTGPTVSVSGTDTSGEITITTGLTPAVNSQIAIINFVNSYSVAPKAILWPSEANASALGFLPYVTSTTSYFDINNAVSVGLLGSTTYKYNYHIIQ